MYSPPHLPPSTMPAEQLYLNVVLCILAVAIILHSGIQYLKFELLLQVRGRQIASREPQGSLAP